jgi:CO/xanthine dehydrogenase FAD-binding subunit
LPAALEALQQGVAIIAGGTDYYPARAGRPLREAGIERVVDLSGIDELRAIAPTQDGYRIGALASWTQIAEADLPPWFDGLRAAAREIGGRQIQNRGTIGGNLCNASPAADGVPALLSLDAQVELASRRGSRRLALADFIFGARKTALAPDEALVAVQIPKPSASAIAGFIKLGSRRYLVISMVMAAAVIEHDAGLVARARIALGACSPVALRLLGLEAALIGRRLDASLGQVPAAAHFDALAPIDDPRASAEYRRHAARVAVSRLLANLGTAA